MAHSSGAVRALNNCNDLVDNVILLDPVKTPFFKNTLNYDYLKKLIIINADLSYKWSNTPPFVPFIPFFDIKLSDLSLEKDKIQLINIENFGHSDLIDKPYRDLMHNIKISKGNPDRNSINKYHKYLSDLIKNFIITE